MLSEKTGRSNAKLMACRGLGHTPDIAADKSHRYFTVAASKNVEALVATTC